MHTHCASTAGTGNLNINQLPFMLFLSRADPGTGEEQQPRKSWAHTRGQCRCQGVTVGQPRKPCVNLYHISASCAPSSLVGLEGCEGYCP